MSYKAYFALHIALLAIVLFGLYVLTHEVQS